MPTLIRTCGDIRALWPETRFLPDYFSPRRWSKLDDDIRLAQGGGWSITLHKEEPPDAGNHPELLGDGSLQAKANRLAFYMGDAEALDDEGLFKLAFGIRCLPHLTRIAGLREKAGKARAPFERQKVLQDIRSAQVYREADAAGRAYCISQSHEKYDALAAENLPRLLRHMRLVADGLEKLYTPYDSCFLDVVEPAVIRATLVKDLLTHAREIARNPLIADALFQFAQNSALSRDAQEIAGIVLHASPRHAHALSSYAASLHENHDSSEADRMVTRAESALFRHLLWHQVALRPNRFVTKTPGRPVMLVSLAGAKRGAGASAAP